jgi:transposase
MIRELYDHGMSISEISRRLNINRKTARKYAKSNEIPRYPKKNKKQSKIDPYINEIKDMINKYNLSAVRIYENIKEKGYNGSYSLVKRTARKYRNDRQIRAVFRFETGPGVQAQVDFGEYGRIEVDGKLKNLYFFSMILGYSRKRYVEFTTDISTANVINLHMKAFRYFNEYTDSILYDNMKQVVLDRKIPSTRSVFNRKFKDFSDYYGFITILCFPYRTQTKGKIENTVKYVKNNFINGRTFSSLEDINNQCALWLEKVNSKVHSTTGRIPDEMAKEEKLNPIDNVPEYSVHLNELRKVSRDCYVSYEGNRYSVPWKYAGREAMVTKTDRIIIKIDNEIVAEHSILEGTGRISRNKEHFVGLLKGIRDQNIMKFDQSVERRGLKKYEEMM